MKNLILLISVLFLFSCTNNAVEYNDQLIVQQYAVADEMNSFMSFLKNAEVDSLSPKADYKIKLDELKNNALQEIRKSKDLLTKLGDYKGDMNFNKALTDVMNSYQNGIENEYYNLGAYPLLPDSMQTPAVYLKTAQAVLYTDSIIDAAEKAFKSAQREFSIKNEIEIANQ